MPTGIFNLKSPDLVNLQKWMKRAPKEFDRAGANVLNSTAFRGRRRAISNIKKGTVTRTPKFVDRSMRVTKAKVGKPLNQLVAEMGSIDISGKGRSDGFESLETGRNAESRRMATQAGRGGDWKKKVAGPIRMNKINKFFKRSQFKGRGRTKHQRTVAMLMSIRRGAIGRQPFIIEGRQRFKLARMKPGVYRMGNKKRLTMVNPFSAGRRRGKTKAIKWMTRSINWATSERNVTMAWKKEADWVLGRRK